MRYIVFVITAGLLIAASAYEDNTLSNYMAFANLSSREYSLGDNQDNSGWRECAEMENTDKMVGVVCEGTRTISVHGGQLVDVNYFCEYHFKRIDSTTVETVFKLCQ